MREANEHAVLNRAVRASAKLLCGVSVSALALLALPTAANAQANLTWAANGGTGGTGTWDTATPNWNNGASSVPWTNGTFDNATFGGTAGTVTTSGSIDVHNITFNTTGYTVSGGTLNLGGATPTITTNAGLSATISSVLTGAAGLTTAGAGTLTLSGVNTFTGTVNVTAGTLSITRDAALGNASNGVTMAAGTQLTMTIPSLLAASRVITLSGGSVTLSGRVGGARFTGAGGIIAQANVNLTNNANDYTGQTQFVTAGTNSFSSIANLGVASALGAPTTGANGTVLASPAAGALVLAYTGTGGSSNRDFSLQNSSASLVQLRNAGSGTLTLTGNIALGGTGFTSTVTFNAVGGDLALLGVISESTARSVAFTGSAGRTITLGGANTWSVSTSISGVTVVAPVLANTGVASSIGTSGATGSGNPSSIQISGNGILSYTGAGASSDRGWTFNGGTLSNNGSGALTLSSVVSLLGTGTLGGTFSGAPNSISGVISGTGGLTVNTAGTWALSGTNTYTGATTVTAGTLQAGAAAGGQAFGSLSAVTLANTAGATLDLNGFSQTIGSLAGGGAAGGNVTLGAGTLTTGGNNTSTTFAGVISGTGGLIMSGSGVQTLSGTNTYTGATTITAGTLQAGAAAGGQAFGNLSAVTLANAAGATLDLNGFNQTIGSLAGGGATGGTVTLGAGTLTTGGNNTSTAFAGVISGTGGLTKTGSGLMTLSGTNTYTGATTVNTGTLQAGAAASGQAFGNLSAVTLANVAGATLDLNGFNQTIGSLAGGGATGGAVTLGAGTLTTGGNNTSTSFAGVISGSGGLTMTGTGVQTLSGTNTYTGATTINAGTLQAGAAAGGQAFGSLSAVTLANAAGATLDLNGFNQTIGSLAGGGAAGGNVTLGSATLTTGGNNTSTTYAGVISGTGGLTKTGSGLMTLSGTNTYTGATTVNAGTLQAGAAAGGQAFGNLSAVTLANAAGAILDLNGFNQTIGSLAGGGATGGAVTLGSATLTTGGNNTSTTYAGVVSGSGGLIMTGTGVQTLTGINTYTGATTINAGTLQAGAAAGGQAFGSLSAVTLANAAGATLDLNGFNQTIGSLAGGGATGGNVTLGSATLTTGGNNASTTFAGVISGGGGFTKTGSGTQILSGANSYSGATTVAGGTLRVNGDQSAATGATSVASGATLGGAGIIGGNVSVAGGGTLSPGNSPGTLTIKGNLSLAGGSLLAYEFGQANIVGGPLNDLTQVSGNLVLGGTINVTVSAGGSFTAGVYRIISYAGALTNNGLAVGTLPAGSTVFVQTSIANQVNLVNTTGVTLNFWDGAAGPKNNSVVDGGNGVWQSGAGNDNWTNVSGALNAPYSNGAFAIFEGAPGTVTIDNGLGNVTATGMQFASNGYVITGNALTLVGPQSTVRVGDGTAAGAGYTATIGAVLSGTTQLVKTDLGTLVLSGTNSYTGGTLINAGTLRISSDANLGNAAGGLTFNGGTLENTAAFTTARTVILTGNGSFQTDADLTLAGVASGAGALTKTGTGKLILTATDTYTGGTTISAGTLQVGNGGAAGAIAGSVTDNAALIFDRSDAIGFGGVISGTGSVSQIGTGATTLGGTNTYAGGTTITAGTLIGSATSFGAGAILDNAALVIDQPADVAFANAINGTGSFTKRGAGRLNYTGTGSLSGPTTVAAGLLSVNGSLAQSAVTVQNGGTLGGNGTVGATIIQSGGTVAPGNSIGTLHVNGAFIQAAGSTYQVEVDPNSNASDRILVSGAATLQSGAGLNVTQSVPGNYQLGTVYTVLSAAGGVSGAYTLSGQTSSVTAFLGLKDSYDANNAYLTVVQTRDPVQAAQTSNQQAVATAIDTLPPTNPVSIAVLNVPDDTAARSAFDQLSAVAQASAKSALVSNGLYVRDITFDRLRDVLCAPEDHAGAAHVGCRSDRPTFWVQGFGGWGGIAGNANAAGLGHSTAGGLVGVDIPVADWRIGVFGGASHSDFRLVDNTASGGSTDYHLGAYGGTQWDDLVLRLGASYSWDGLTTDRAVTVGSFTDRLQAIYEGGTTQAFADLGYTLELWDTRFEPFANLAYVSLHTPAFSEAGGPAALSVRADTIDDTVATFGVRPSADVSWDGWNMTLRGMIGLRHTLGRVVPTATASFAGSNAFTVSGAPIARDAAALEAGVDFGLYDNVTAGLTYGGQFSNISTDQIARGTIRVNL